MNLKLAVRNSLELIRIATGDRDVSTSGVHESVFHDESRVFIVEVCTPIILPLVMIEIELIHTTCAITSITKLTHPVMTRSDKYPLQWTMVPEAAHNPTHRT